MAGAKPTRGELAAAATNTVPDVIAPGLRILFCGINPGLYSAWAGHHFARPGNRFWPTLYAAGFTPRQFTPAEQADLLPLGYGITNLVERATAIATGLTSDELRAGAVQLAAKVQRYQPRVLAVLGVTAYRAGFARPHAVLGRQADLIGVTPVWVLPNPSGLNAHYTPAALAALFRDFRLAIEAAV